MTYKKDTSEQDDDAIYDQTWLQHNSDERIHMKIESKGNLMHKLHYVGG